MSHLLHKAYTLLGKATSVFRSVNDEVKLACKNSDPKGWSTLRVQIVLGFDTGGFCALRIIILKLAQITKCKGDKFMKAWLDAVTCHAFLWGNGIQHGDPSLWNIMYYPEYKYGVLTDFDLSIIPWSKRIPGVERTGTIPFMALNLLNPAYYWGGTQTRYYHHELEAFIWIFLFVCLSYENGHRVASSRRPRDAKKGINYTNDWQDSNYGLVHAWRAGFLRRSDIPQMVTDDFSSLKSLFKVLFEGLDGALGQRL